MNAAMKRTLDAVSSSVIAQGGLDLPSRLLTCSAPTRAASAAAHARHRGSQARGGPPTP